MVDYMDEFVYRAWVQDDTLSFFERFDKYADQYRARATDAFDTSERGANSSTLAVGALAGAVAGVVTQLVNMAVAAGKTFLQFMNESLELAARVEVLGINLYRIAERLGYSKDETDALVGSLKDLGITTQGAYNSLLLLSRANIDWSEATKLARIAQDSAVIAGINSTQAFERLARGIQKMEPELLDELGITLRRSDAYDRYAAMLGVTAKQLTEVQQRTAVLNEIYRQSEVVSGSYEASLATAGKQAASLARHVEELQLALGKAFQPLYTAKIEFMTDAVKTLSSFVKDNEEELLSLGQTLGDVLTKGLNILLKLLDLILRLNLTLTKWKNAFGEYLQSLFGDETSADIKQWWDDIKEAAGQVISLVSGAISAAIAGLGELVRVAGATIKGIRDVIAGDISLADFGANMVDMFAHPQEFLKTIATAFVEGTYAAGTFLGLLEEVDDTTKKTGTSASNAADSMNEFTDSMDEAAAAAEAARIRIENLNRAQESLNSIRKSYARSEEDRLRQEHRRSIENDINLSQQRISIELRFQQEIARIRATIEQQKYDASKQYDADVLDAAASLSEERVQIEKNYQDSVEALQRDFEYSAAELARNRDAVGLTRLIRDNKRRLEEENITRQKNLESAQQNYTKRLEELRKNYEQQQQLLDASLQKQLDAAEDAREEDYRNLEQSLEDQRRMQNMADRWAEEDRQIALRRQIEDWQDQYDDLEGITSSGLLEMLDDWSIYFNAVEGVTAQGARKVRDALRPLYDALNGVISETSSSGSVDNTIYVTYGNRRSEVTGQMGQISQLLVGGNIPNIFGGVVPAPIATTGARPSVDRREIAIKVDGNALDPYMQRVVANTLFEIERNRG